jgi:hypothetical protein
MEERPPPRHQMDVNNQFHASAVVERRNMHRERQMHGRTYRWIYSTIHICFKTFAATWFNSLLGRSAALTRLNTPFRGLAPSPSSGKTDLPEDGHGASPLKVVIKRVNAAERPRRLYWSTLHDKQYFINTGLLQHGSRVAASWVLKKMFKVYTLGFKARRCMSQQWLPDLLEKSILCSLLQVLDGSNLCGKTSRFQTSPDTKM